MGKVVNEKIILGMDPGTNEMGYGIIIVNGSQLTLQQFGVIHLKKYATHELKLKKIFENVTSLLNRHKPHRAMLCHQQQNIVPGPSMIDILQY